MTNAKEPAVVCAAELRAAKVARMEVAVRAIIRGLGEDIEREGLLDTPKRVSKALLDVTAGYHAHPSSASVLGGAFFHEPIVKDGNSGIVLVRDIDFASTCEETLLPFHGKCHVAYMPGEGVVLGLSKLARLAKFYAKRLQSQQRLGMEIAAALQEHLACDGVAVVLQAAHLIPCEGPPPITTTAALSGCFSPGTTDLQELEELLAIPDLAAASSCLASASGSRASISSIASLASSPAGDLESGTDDEPSFDAKIFLDLGNASAAGKKAPVGLEGMEDAVRSLLLEIGEDVTRPGVQDTARQHIRCLLASTSGYQMRMDGSCDHADKVRGGCFGCQGKPATTSKLGATSAPLAHAAGAPVKLVHIKVPFHSQCEHHMLPFYGNAHITCAYPADHAAEQMDSETQAQLEAIVAMYTRRLQVQERITHQVADAVASAVPCAGIMVVVDAAHMCMVARGVENHAGSTTSSAVRGVFCQAPELRRATMQEARQLTMRV